MKITEVENKMKDRIDFFEESLSEIRAGRANPAILNRVMVEYYGTPTPINQVSSVSVPEARQILIQPWDMSILKAIERAIIDGYYTKLMKGKYPFAIIFYKNLTLFLVYVRII